MTSPIHTTSPARTTLAKAAASLLTLLLLALPAIAATGTHLPDSTFYPRLVRLHYGPAALRNTLLAKTTNKLYRSTDEGRTFTYLAAVPTVSEKSTTASPDKERCCSTLYELPRTIGRLKAGTLLYAGSFLSEGIPSVLIFSSTDQGAHWTYLSTPLKAGDMKHGLWEPEFTVAGDHSLIMFVSDETDPCCSQKLVQMRSTDGLHWGPKHDTVASTSQPDRPGMASVSLLPDHTYFMSYEICGPVTHCQVYIRTSSDGLDFGTPTGFGTKVVSTSGQYFEHAPVNIFDLATRRLILAGQVLYEADGTVSPQNGRLLFTGPLAGPWQAIAAPVEVPSAYDNFCPNYSSALMPTPGGLLELASDYDAAHACTSYFATTPVR